MLENASGDRHLTDDVYGCMAVWAFWPAAKLGKPWHDHPILGSGRLLAPPERSWIVHGSHHILSIFSDASGLIIRLVVWTLSPFCGHILILLIMSLFSLILIIILSYSHPPTVKCSPGLVLDLFFLGSHQNGVYDMIGGWNRSHCLFFFLGCLCHSRHCVSQRPWPQWWDVCATWLWHRRWRAILTHIEILQY